MTQRNQPPLPSPESHRISRGSPCTNTPRGAMDQVWIWAFMIVLLAIAAASVIARGEVADAELRFAMVAVKAASAPQDICSASGDWRFKPVGQACEELSSGR